MWKENSIKTMKNKKQKEKRLQSDFRKWFCWESDWWASTGPVVIIRNRAKVPKVTCMCKPNAERQSLSSLYLVTHWPAIYLATEPHLQWDTLSTGKWSSKISNKTISLHMYTCIHYTCTKHTYKQKINMQTEDLKAEEIHREPSITNQLRKDNQLIVYQGKKNRKQ